ncbi:MAG: TonB-dependent receptor [Parasphingorhabdus sp.]|uniref:TonB-dependent receptor n=1 Tax=Parasphingorhabdus sp. TaxID=2709688 RepID=UPI003298DD10
MLKVKNIVKTSVCGAVLASAWMASQASAQEISEADGAEDGVIVVTARKNEENLLEVPVAITAFSSEAIEAKGLNDINDLQAFTPGFVYESFATLPGRFDNSPRFRGVGVNTGSPTRQTASVFIDGIFVANGAQGVTLSDVERVEIIKGPQSAFFGRNTFGGAVNYITKTPGDDFGVDYSATLGTRDLYQGALGIDVPISETLKFRATGSYRHKGGHYTNSVNGEEVGKEETWSVAGTVFFEPSENFDAKIRVNYFENEDSAPAIGFVDSSFHNCGPFTTDGVTGTDRTFCGDVPITQPALNTDQTPGIIDFYQNTLFQLNGNPRDEFGLDRQSLRASLQFNVSFPNSSVVFSWLTGLNYDEVNLLQDGDYGAPNQFVSYAGRQFRDFSQEIRLTGESFNGLLDWSVGANYFDQRFTNNGEFIVPAFGNFAFGNGEPAEEQIETLGLFGSAQVNFTDELSLVGEARYQIDTVREDDDITDANGFSKGTFRSFLPRIILNYQATPDTLVYASFSEGNLPGGFNGSVAALSPTELTRLDAIQPGVGPTFGEETLRNYEIGLKHNFGGAGFVSLAAFYMDRTGQTVRRSDRIALDGQVNTMNTTQVNYFINIGESQIKGIEFEGSYELLEGFTLSATAAYIDSELSFFDNSGIYLEVFGSADASGTRGERFPKFSGSVSAQYTGSLNADWDFFLRGDGAYTGRRLASEINLTSAEPGFQANLRAGVESEGLRIEAFVTNLTNDDSPTAINRFRDLTLGFGGFSIFGHMVGLRDRRQFGLRLSGDF